MKAHLANLIVAAEDCEDAPQHLDGRLVNAFLFELFQMRKELPWLRTDSLRIKVRCDRRQQDSGKQQKGDPANASALHLIHNYGLWDKPLY